MTKIGDVLVELKASSAQFFGEMDKARGAFSDLSSSMSQVTMAAGAASAALTAVGIVAAKTAASFEFAVTSAAALANQGNVTAEVFGALESSALDLAAATKFTAREVADAQGEMALAGQSVNEIVGNLPSVLQLATGASIEVAKAAGIVTGAMKGFGLETAALARTNDILVSALTGSRVTLETLGGAFQKIGPTARGLGLDFTEVTAAISVLGDRSIDSGEAGRGLSRALIALTKPSKESARVMAQLGLSATDATAGFETIVRKLEAVRGRFKPEEFSQAIFQVFDAFGGRVVQALVGAGSGALRTMTTRLRESEGIAKRIETAKIETFAGQFDILRSKVERAVILLGKELIPLLKPLVSAAGAAADAFANLARENRELIAKVGAFAAAVTAGTAALAGITGGVAALGALLPALKAGLVGVGAAMVPLLLPIAKVVLLVGAAIFILGVLAKAWKEDWGEIRRVTGVVVDTIVQTVKDLGNAVLTVFSVVSRGIIDLLTFPLRSVAFLQARIAELLETVVGIGGDFAARIGIDITGVKGLVAGARAISQNIERDINDLVGAVKEFTDPRSLVETAVEFWTGPASEEAIDSIGNAGKAIGVTLEEALAASGDGLAFLLKKVFGVEGDKLQKKIEKGLTKPAAVAPAPAPVAGPAGVRAEIKAEPGLGLGGVLAKVFEDEIRGSFARAGIDKALAQSLGGNLASAIQSGRLNLGDIGESIGGAIGAAAPSIGVAAGGAIGGAIATQVADFLGDAFKRIGASLSSLINRAAGLFTADPIVGGAVQAFSEAFVPLLTIVPAAAVAFAILAPLLVASAAGFALLATILLPLVVLFSPVIAALLTMAAAVAVAAAVVLAIVGVIALALAALGIFIGTIIAVITAAVAMITGIGFVVAAIGQFVAAVLLLPAILAGLAGGFLFLLGQTETFGKITQAIGAVIKTLVLPSVEMFAGKLVFAVGLFEKVALVFRALLFSFGGGDGTAIAEFLFFAMKNLAIVALEVVTTALQLSNALLGFGAIVVRVGSFFAKIIEAIGGFFGIESDQLATFREGLDRTGSALEAMKVNTDGMSDAIDELRGLTFDEATERGNALVDALEELEDGVSDTTDTFQGLNEAGANLPQFFRRAALAGAATVSGAGSMPGVADLGGGAAGAGGGAPMSMNIETLSVVASEPQELFDKLQRLSEQRSWQLTGQPVARAEGINGG